MCLSGFLKEYVEAYASRARFVHPRDGQISLGPLGDITTSLASMRLGHGDVISCKRVN